MEWNEYLSIYVSEAHTKLFQCALEIDSMYVPSTIRQTI